MERGEKSGEKILLLLASRSTLPETKKQRARSMEKGVGERIFCS
jgi:hypothetical protein